MPVITAMMMTMGWRPTRSPMMRGEMTRPSRVLHDGEDAEDDEGMGPVAELHDGQRQGGQAEDGGAQKRGSWKAPRPRSRAGWRSSGRRPESRWCRARCHRGRREPRNRK